MRCVNIDVNAAYGGELPSFQGHIYIGIEGSIREGIFPIQNRGKSHPFSS